MPENGQVLIVPAFFGGGEPSGPAQAPARVSTVGPGGRIMGA